MDLIAGLFNTDPILADSLLHLLNEMFLAQFESQTKSRRFYDADTAAYHKP